MTFRRSQKGPISKQLLQENKARQIFRKTNIFYSLIRTRTCAYQGTINVCFSESLAGLCFLVVLRFAFLPHYDDLVLTQNLKYPSKIYLTHFRPVLHFI